MCTLPTHPRGSPIAQLTIASPLSTHAAQGPAMRCAFLALPLLLSATQATAFLRRTPSLPPTERRLQQRAASMADASSTPTSVGADSHEWVFDVLFTGTGQSSSVPLLKHIVVPGTCKTCDDALTRPGSKNKRNNVSCALIKRKRSTPLGQTPRCVLIDCGKTFREVILNLFPKHGLREVGALLITHGHADAILGMDDLRDIQIYEQVDPGVRYTSGPINVYLHEQTMEDVRSRFPYLCNKPVYLDEAKGILERPVSYLKYHVVDVNAEIDADSLPVRCFPVLHGGDYVSLGFTVGKPGEFVYISDVKAIPPETWAYLRGLPPIKTLVLDSIKWNTNNYAHASVDEVLPWVDELKPERVWLVGAGCGWGDHDEANAELARRGYPHVQLAHDGLYLEGFRL